MSVRLVNPIQFARIPADCSGIRSVMLAAMLLLAAAASKAEGGFPEDIAIAPDESRVVIRMGAASEDDVRWRDVVVEMLGMSVANAEQGWSRASGLVDRMGIAFAERIHAVDATGSQWIHAARWSDAAKLQSSLRRAEARPLGFGRFRFVAPRIDLAIAGDWVLLAPTGSPWLDGAAERAGIAAGEFSNAPAVIDVRLRHDAPTGGTTRLELTPLGPTEASIEIDGRYDSSPLPARSRGRVDARLIPSLRGRVAMAMLESGVGVLDPTLIRLSAQRPELMPPAEVRRSLATRRLVVLDGETVRIPRIGLIEVPAMCIAIPCRTETASPVARSTFDAMIHDWMADSGRALAARSPVEDADEPVGIRIARDEIRHLDLGDGFADSFGRHPASIATSLNWVIRRVGPGAAGDAPHPDTWLVVGSSPGIVRRVGRAIEDVNVETPGDEPPTCSQGVASPARLGLQVADLAGLRAESSDSNAPADSAVLARLAAILTRFEHVEWSTSVQSDEAVRGILRVTLTPDASERPMRDAPAAGSGGRRDP
ncbi:MAG: hypothetical protein ACYSUU_04970 [Planctomycetota bacterium]|jgi:hypothetical protein